MFLRTADFIERGIVDNRKQGTTQLILWFKGNEKPVEVDLVGDCLGDIAGTRLEFKSTSPNVQATKLDSSQYQIKGIVGDMTASRKTISKRDNKVYNYLYLEWFTNDGNVFTVEGCDYEYKVSLPEWEMDEFDEQAQLMANQQAMRDQTALWVHEFAQRMDGDYLPHYKWDIRLKEAEAIALIYMDIIQKYKHETMGDIRTAFVMGWDHVLDEIASADETGGSYSSKYTGSLSLFDILTEEENETVQNAMEANLFQEIMEISERSQGQFAKQVNRLVSDVPSNIQTFYSCLKFITPRVLACLIQEKESDADFDTMSRRIALCAKHVKAALPAVATLQSDFYMKSYEDQLKDIHESLLAYHDSLVAQIKKKH